MPVGCRGDALPTALFPRLGFLSKSIDYPAFVCIEVYYGMKRALLAVTVPYPNEGSSWCCSTCRDCWVSKFPAFERRAISAASSTDESHAPREAGLGRKILRPPSEAAKTCSGRASGAAPRLEDPGIAGCSSQIRHIGG